MLQAAYNNVVVKVKTKYIKNFTSIMKIAHIQNNSSVEMADTVNIVGEIVSIPKAISTRRDYQGFSQKDLRVGDAVIMSHYVIFNFLSTLPNEPPKFKNLVRVKDQEFFCADIRYIFAVIRGEQVRMQNGYVMLEDLENPKLIVLSAATKKLTNAYSGKVSYVGRSLVGKTGIEVQRGDRVYFHPNKVMNYQINDKPFGIIKQQDIFGREVPKYAELVEIH